MQNMMVVCCRTCQDRHSTKTPEGHSRRNRRLRVQGDCCPHANDYLEKVGKETVVQRERRFNR